MEKIIQNHTGEGDNVKEKHEHYYEALYTKPKTLNQAITEWQSQTKIPLNPKLALQSREKEIEELFSLLSQSPSKVIVVSPRSEEESYSYAFIINALSTQEGYADRVKIIKSQERGADEGGEQEHALADKYQVYAKDIQFIHPRTSNILQKISDSYRYAAKREDIRNEL